MNKTIEPKFEPPNLTAESPVKFAKLFPGVIAEGKGNFEQIFKTYSPATIRKVL